MKDEAGANFSRRAAIGVVGAAATGALAAGAAPAAKPADKVTIYHVEGRRSQRIIWLCEELNIPYELMFKRGDITGSVQMLKAVNPAMAMAPTIVFRGKTMVESGGIIEYLMSQFPHGEARLAPPRRSPDYADYKMWMHFAEGTAACRLHNELMRMAAGGERKIMPNMLAGVYKLVGAQDVVEYLEAYIAAHPYFGGQTFSAADIMMDFVMTTYIKGLPFDPASYRNLSLWQARVQARPAFQRALAIGLPDGMVNVMRRPPRVAPSPETK